MNIGILLAVLLIGLMIGGGAGFFFFKKDQKKSFIKLFQALSLLHPSLYSWSFLLVFVPLIRGK